MSEQIIFSRKNLCFIPLTAVALMLAGCSNDFGPFSMPSGYAHHNKEYKAPPGSELVAVPETEETVMIAEPEGEDPVTQMDFTTEPEDYFEKAPVSKPADISMRPMEEDFVPAEDRGERDSYESYVEPTYVYDQSYEERRLRQAADRATSGTYDRRVSNTAPLEDNYAISAAQDLVDRMGKEFGRPVEPVYLQEGLSGDPAVSAFKGALRQAMLDQDYSLADSPGQGPFIMGYEINRLGGTGNQALVTITLMNGKTKMGEMSGTYPMGSSYESSSESTSTTDSEAMDARPKAIPRDSGISYPPDAISEPVSLFEP